MVNRARTLRLIKQSMTKIVNRIGEEILPFFFFYFRKRKQIKLVSTENFGCGSGSYEVYHQLSENELESRISQEHERAKSMDDKTFKMTLAISFGLTVLGSTANLLLKEIPVTEYRIIVAVFASLSIFYSMAAGFTAIGALKTLPTFGYGTDFAINGKKNKSVLVHALAAQEKMNIIRHLRNESSYQSLRNSMILLFLALTIFALSFIVHYFQTSPKALGGLLAMFRPIGQEIVNKLGILGFTATFINQFSALFLGIIASLIAWWILFHRLSPQLRFSDNISKITANDEPNGHAYRVKFENSGRRNIIDLTITARLRIWGLGRMNPQNIETTCLPLSLEGEYPSIRPKRKTGESHLVRIRLTGKGHEFEREVYPKVIREKAKNGSLALEDVLSIGDCATIQVTALGSDSFSGSRKAFFSTEYTKENIVAKRFKKDSLKT